METDLILLLPVTVQGLITHACFVHGVACGTPSFIFHNPLPCPVFSTYKWLSESYSNNNPHLKVPRTLVQHYSYISQFLFGNWHLKQLCLAIAKVKYYVSKCVVSYWVHIYVHDANLPVKVWNYTHYTLQNNIYYILLSLNIHQIEKKEYKRTSLRRIMV